MHCDIGAYEFGARLLADLQISKSAAKTAQSGRQLDYIIHVTHNGPDTADAVVVNDFLPAGTSL